MGKLIEMVGRLLPAALETDFPRHQTLVLPLLRYMTSHKLFYTLSHLLILDENFSSRGVDTGNRQDKKIGLQRQRPW